MPDTLPDDDSAKLRRVRVGPLVSGLILLLSLGAFVVWLDFVPHQWGHDVYELIFVNLFIIAAATYFVRQICSQLSVSLHECGLAYVDLWGRQHFVRWKEINEVRFSDNSVTLLTPSDKIAVGHWYFRKPSALYELIESKLPWLDRTSRKRIQKR